MKCSNPECDNFIIQNRPHHKYCDRACRNRANWFKRKPFSRKGPLTPEAMKEKMARGMTTRFRNAVQNVPDRYFLVINEIISHKLTLSAQLVSVRGVMTAFRRRAKLLKGDMEWPLKEALYHIISNKLEENGGVLTDFTGHRMSKDIKDSSHMIRVYKFPPLKERKT